MAECLCESIIIHYHRYFNYMKKYEEQKFSIPALKGISEKAIAEHLKLYGGYVKNANLIMEKIGEYMMQGPEKTFTAVSELWRRFSFEFDGMRNHEYYFRSLEGGSKPLPAGSSFKAAVEELAPFEMWLQGFKDSALARGIGWAMLMWDPHLEQIVFTWVDQQHQGHLIDTRPILLLDMWEHSYLFDYVPADKKKYVEAFFENLNWEVIEKNFRKALGR